MSLGIMCPSHPTTLPCPFDHLLCCPGTTMIYSGIRVTVYAHWHSRPFFGLCAPFLVLLNEYAPFWALCMKSCDKYSWSCHFEFIISRKKAYSTYHCDEEFTMPLRTSKCLFSGSESIFVSDTLTFELMANCMQTAYYY